jgi:hypothetical protein
MMTMWTRRTVAGDKTRHLVGYDNWIGTKELNAAGTSGVTDKIWQQMSRGGSQPWLPA